MQDATEFRTNRDLFSNHYLDEHLPETDAWESVDATELQEAYDDIAYLWESERDLVADRNESQLEEVFIRPMFKLLDIPYEVEESVERGERRPDYGFFQSKEAADNAFVRRREGGDFYKNAVAVADAKRWGRKLDTRGERQRDFENPSYQIHVYLQETPATWAVLTNGEYWRLYYGPTSHRLDSYYEIDLPAVLESGDLEAFKYFYLFFQHEAFLPDASGDCFLDDVYEESNVFAEELGEDLQDNIYDAIQSLAEGFLTYPENDLGADDLDLIHDSSLIYLYRLIFVLYAESEGRDLLNTDNEIYEQSYSLNTIKQEVAEELDSDSPSYQSWQDDLWDRIDELFQLIDQGSASRDIPKEDLHIPAYNGGLFRTNPDSNDSPETKFLATHAVGDEHLARVIELLTRSRTGSSGKIFVDYSSLDVRHLGSVYEGLLEYQLNVAEEPLTLEDGEYVLADGGAAVAVEPGEVYLTTDSGERKATGSYYTPEYVVEYIVENTLGPLVEDIRKDLAGNVSYGDDESGFAQEFAERVFDLKILDPAMGSGHFLTNTIDYLAREIIDAQERQAEQQGVETVDEGQDINWARRQVAQHCIYGVDLNPLAVELAKVSLWLRTLAAEQPLAFLDHHLKTGNSLVGSDIESIDELETDSNGGPNASLADFGAVRRGTIDHLMDVYEEFIAIENTDLADAKEMERKYREIERDDLRTRLVAMANVKTAEDFDLDLSGGAYERMARALDSEDEWAEIEQKGWYREAQRQASASRYFHWKLEFPEAFYEVDGSDQESPGFDAVIGNPPYVRMEQIKPLKPYLSTEYDVHGERVDLYAYFIEQSLDLAARKYGVIVSNKWTKSEYGEALRKTLAKHHIDTILDFGDLEVFAGVSTYPCILLVDVDSSPAETTTVVQFENLDFTNLGTFVAGKGYEIPVESFGSGKWALGTAGEGELLRSIVSAGTVKLSNHEEVVGSGVNDGIGWGIKTGGNEAFVIGSEKRDELISNDSNSRQVIKSLLKGRDISRYEIENEQRFLIYVKHGINIENYPAVRNHLEQYREVIGSTATAEEWYELQQPQAKYERFFESEKICYPDISKECNFALDSEGRYLANTCYFIPSDSRALLAVLNSTVVDWYYQYTTSEYRGGYQRSFTHAIKDIPIPKSLSENDGRLTELGQRMTELKQQRSALNLSLPDYLGNYEDGPTLGDLYQPPAGLANSILTDTTEERANLRVGTVTVVEEESKLVVRVTARYKPENPDEHETDRWDYTETDPDPAMEFVGLSDAERALIRAFVLHATDEAGGFAGFRETATKTNSLVDRLEALTLPELSDVEDGLKRYRKQKERSEELDEKIEKTDELIDQIVYQLYGLTDEEIEIVEEAVGE